MLFGQESVPHVEKIGILKVSKLIVRVYPRRASAPALPLGNGGGSNRFHALLLASPLVAMLLLTLGVFYTV